MSIAWRRGEGVGDGARVECYCKHNDIALNLTLPILSTVGNLLSFKHYFACTILTHSRCVAVHCTDTYMYICVYVLMCCAYRPVTCACLCVCCSRRLCALSAHPSVPRGLSKEEPALSQSSHLLTVNNNTIKRPRSFADELCDLERCVHPVYTCTL